MGGEMKKGGDGFDVEDEYARFRRRQRIHRMHLVGYAVSAALVLIGMLLFCMYGCFDSYCVFKS